MEKRHRGFDKCGAMRKFEGPKRVCVLIINEM